MTNKNGARDWASHPSYIAEDYKSTRLRGPTKPLIPLPETLSELTGPVYGHGDFAESDTDLTRNGAITGTPLGERIVVEGTVRDESGKPLTNTLIEIWQANSAGRYIHTADQHDAPIDPNFFGGGRCITDEKGKYRFYTIKPGAYPWGNHTNAWRPAHIHLSLFGPTFATRLITQFYFPGDPLLKLDPIFLSTPAEARDRLIADFSLDATQEGFALGYNFDIVLRGHNATPMEA